MTTWFTHLLKTYVNTLKVKYVQPDNYEDFDPVAISTLFTMVGSVFETWDTYLAEDTALSALHTLLELEGHKLITYPSPVLSNGEIQFSGVDDFLKLQICAFLVPGYREFEHRIITVLVTRNKPVTMCIAQLRKTLARYFLRYLIKNISLGNILLVTGRMSEQQWSQVYLGLCRHVVEDMAPFVLAIEASADQLGPVVHLTSEPDAIRWKMALNINVPLCNSVFPNASQ